MSLQSRDKVWSYFANSKTNKHWLALEEEIMAILKKNVGSNTLDVEPILYKKGPYIILTARFHDPKKDVASHWAQC